MSARVRTALAVGALVAAEIALGILLFLRGTEEAAPVSPFRVGDGFPQPPHCWIADEAQLKRMLGTYEVSSRYRVEGYDTLRECTFDVPGQVRQDFTMVELTMRSRNAPRGSHLDNTRPGPSELDLSDDLSVRVHKRYFNEAFVRFSVDNLEVMVRVQGSTVGSEPPPEDFGRRFRDEAMALAAPIQAQLVPRNKTTRPTPTR